MTLPSGLTLLPDQDSEQEVEVAGELSQVSWRCRSAEAGTYTLSVTSESMTERYKVKIKASSIFN